MNGAPPLPRKMGRRFLIRATRTSLATNRIIGYSVARIIGFRVMKLPALFALKGEPKFVTDGCSGYMSWLWRFFFGKDPPWQGGCVIHDWYYWSGGSPINGRAAYQIRRLGGGEIAPTSPWHMRVFSRRDADAFLYRYVRDKGYLEWAWLIWIGVRIGGSQYFPFAWRWRYRYNYFDVVRGM